MSSRKLFSLWTPVSGVERDRAGAPFRAVEIHCKADGCSAAQSLSGRRFLCAEAPMLPLPECDRQSQCECYYRRHADRRCGPRRHEESGAPPPPVQRSRDERTADGRRAEDRAPAHEDADLSLLADTYYDYVAEKLGD